MPVLLLEWALGVIRYHLTIRVVLFGIDLDRISGLSIPAIDSRRNVYRLIWNASWSKRIFYLDAR